MQHVHVQVSHQATRTCQSSDRSSRYRYSFTIHVTHKMYIGADLPHCILWRMMPARCAAEAAHSNMEDR